MSRNRTVGDDYAEPTWWEIALALLGLAAEAIRTTWWRATSGTTITRSQLLATRAEVERLREVLEHIHEVASDTRDEPLPRSLPAQLRSVATLASDALHGAPR